MRDVQLTILKVLAGVHHQHKFNLLGRGSDQGIVEAELGTRFNADERHMAAVAFVELEAAGFIRPTYEDLIAPESWVAITDSGRVALTRGTVEALEQLLGLAVPKGSERELEQKFKILFSIGQATIDFNEWLVKNGGSTPVSLVFIDIDNFKSLNTAYTETMIDRSLLPEFQRELAAVVGSCGYAYRHGGEEFVIALPQHTKPEAVVFAERLRLHIEAPHLKLVRARSM
jgi:diguanylate cyclase (GGDEF)-like protein